MLNKYLIEAKIVPVYDPNNVTYEKKIAIYSLTKTMYLYPIIGGLSLRKNRKYSTRRLLRWAKRGCFLNIQESEPEYPGYQTVYLEREDLEGMIVGMMEMDKEKLINKLYEVNARKCIGSNVGKW